MIDGDPIGRPRKTLKNYPDLTLRAMEEANQLQSEANSIALRRLTMDKEMLLVYTMAHDQHSTIKQINQLRDKLSKI